MLVAPPVPKPAALTSSPYPPTHSPTLLQRLSSSLLPLLILFGLVLSGLPSAVVVQLSRPRPFHLLNPLRWWSLIFQKGFPEVLAASNVLWSNVKSPLLQNATGVVLEVGAGSGENLVYYDHQKIEKLYALEPFEPLRGQLRTTLEKRTRLSDRTTIVPHGIDQRSKLDSEFGIRPSSIDTVVLVQVLCSIPDPEPTIEYLASLLRPGGQILLFEHVASKDPLSRFVQNLWSPIWSRLMGGCELNRPSDQWLSKLQAWQSVQLARPDCEVSVQRNKA
ncbi:hypothetical protein IE53DRAFT_382812 [Violaceomyces palustris]|uniref:Uncharacterized protein n=1 Tax=Violaceomyces palustris TaxID=1673888 RepID=A0ACD0NL28_9BASI|nr:hypothetical protein IE53DRAFT_382812 [Violaceomyces palustris]